ncbi:MAG: alpha-mannosidase, partial [Cyanobacteriota bacterium]
MTQLILDAIANLRQLTQVDVQNSWYLPSSLPPTRREEINVGNQDENDFIAAIPKLIDISSWEIASLNEKGYSVFPAGQKVRWFAQKFVVPETLKGYPLAGLTLRLALTWWAEDAKIYVNEKLVQEGDLFDSSARILLTKKAIPGEEIFVAIRLVSPGHDIGALMRSRLLYEAPNLPLFDAEANSIDPGFVADELSVLYSYLEVFESDKLKILYSEIVSIDWNKVTDAIAFNQCLLNLRQRLLPLAKTLKERTIKMVGHAHLDMAWLWPVSETWEVAQRTFESVLNLQKDFPYLTFCHTTPALYEWIEKHRPDLFSVIQDAVKDESWEVLGGMWVEPEMNLIS